MGNFVLDRLAAHAPIMKSVSLPRGRSRLHTMPTSTGYEIRTDESYSWDGRKRGHKAFTVLQHTVAGAGNLRFERRTVRVHPSETLLVTVPHDHRYWVEHGGRWEYFWISMTGQEALRLHRNIIAEAGPVLRLRSVTVERLADCCLKLIEGAHETPGRASALAYEAIMAVHDDVFDAGTEHVHGSMRHVIEHIRANLRDPLSVQELASFSGLSRAHFTRQFAAASGMALGTFVMHERMKRAAQLLLEEESPSVKTIATMAGFADANYFGKVFHRMYDTSPSRFRLGGQRKD